MVYEKGEKDAGWYKRCDSVIENTIQFINYAFSHHMSMFFWGHSSTTWDFPVSSFVLFPQKPQADTMRDLEMDEAWGYLPT